MNDTATLVLSIIGAVIVWTASIISLTVWLTEKFDDLNSTIYREMDKHRRDDDRQFDNLGRRVQRIEIHAFGFAGPVAVEPRSIEEEG